MNGNQSWLPVWMMVHVIKSRRVDAMLIYWAAMVPPTPTYNIIYTVSNFDEYVPITVIRLMLSENSLL